MKEDFDTIYRKNRWGVGSGTGSSPKYCKKYLDWLGQFILDNDIYSVVDIGCGDMQLYEGFDWGDINYVGCEISPTAISLARERTDLHIVEVDNYRDSLLVVENNEPDLVIIKDVLQHWTDAEIRPFLRRLKYLNWRFVVTVNNWKYIRSPEKEGTPRDLNNRYRWAPIAPGYGSFVRFGFEKVFTYKSKMVMVAEK